MNGIANPATSPPTKPRPQNISKTGWSLCVSVDDASLQEPFRRGLSCPTDGYGPNEPADAERDSQKQTLEVGTRQSGPTD